MSSQRPTGPWSDRPSRVPVSRRTPRLKEIDGRTGRRELTSIPPEILDPSWLRHPAVRNPDELTPGERAADRVRNGMGSWVFVFCAVLFLAVWIAGNGLMGRGRHHAFDAYPFILLNLVLSCLAAMQGAILLIAAKRTDQISSELAAHDYEIDCRAEKLIEENTALTLAVKELTETIHGILVDQTAK